MPQIAPALESDVRGHEPELCHLLAGWPFVNKLHLWRSVFSSVKWWQRYLPWQPLYFTTSVSLIIFYAGTQCVIDAGTKNIAADDAAADGGGGGDDGGHHGAGGWVSVGLLLSIQYCHWEIAPKHSRIMGFPGWKGSQRPFSPAFSMWYLNTFKLVFHPLFQHLSAGASSNSLPLMFFLSDSFLTWKKGLIMPRRKECGRRQRSCMSKTKQERR